MNEAFVYLWFDSKNRKFYLGKHKGTPDDGYTHSSTVMESFDVPPPHMKRRILAWGTDEEMCLLEHELLKNRKNKKWDLYYNKSLGFPWLDQWGKNNPSYKHGMSYDKEYQRNIGREYRRKNREKINELETQYYQKNKEKILQSREQYRTGPHREKHLECQRQYAKKYRACAENKEKFLEYQRQYRARKKAEKLAQQTGATLPL